MVEAGYVENVRQAFNKYLGDDGPAYARLILIPNKHFLW
jgi:predicted metal-dependent phosphoesterase TrpH